MLTVSISNFKSVKNMTMSFNSGINLLHGVSGAGKTTVIEAITWCLYDGHDYRNFNADSRVVTKVRVSFYAYDMVVTRTSTPAKSFTVSDIDGNPRDPEVVARIFGSRKLFDTTTHIRQKGINAFLYNSDITIDELLYRDPNTPRTKIKKIAEIVNELLEKRPNLELLAAHIKAYDKDLKMMLENGKLTREQIKNHQENLDHLMSMVEPYNQYMAREQERDSFTKRIADYELRGYTEALLKLQTCTKFARFFNEDFEFEGYSTISTFPLPERDIDQTLAIDKLVSEEAEARNKILEELNSATITLSSDEFRYLIAEETRTRNELYLESYIQLHNLVASPSSKIFVLLAKENAERNAIAAKSQLPSYYTKFDQLVDEENVARNKIVAQAVSTLNASVFLNVETLAQEENASRSAIITEYQAGFPRTLNLDSFLELENSSRCSIIAEAENEFYATTTVSNLSSLVLQECQSRTAILRSWETFPELDLAEQERRSRNAIIAGYNLETTEIVERWNLQARASLDFATIFQPANKQATALAFVKNKLGYSSVSAMVEAAPISCATCGQALDANGNYDRHRIDHVKIVEYMYRNGINRRTMITPPATESYPRWSFSPVTPIAALPIRYRGKISLPMLSLTPSPKLRLGFPGKIVLPQLRIPSMKPMSVGYVPNRSRWSMLVPWSFSPVVLEKPRWSVSFPAISLRFYQNTLHTVTGQVHAKLPTLVYRSRIGMVMDKGYNLAAYTRAQIRSMMVNHKHSYINKELYMARRLECNHEYNSTPEKFKALMGKLTRYSEKELVKYAYLKENLQPSLPKPDFDAELLESLKRFNKTKFDKILEIRTEAYKNYRESVTSFDQINEKIHEWKGLSEKIEIADSLYKAYGIDYVTNKVNTILTAAMNSDVEFRLTVGKTLSWELEYNGFVRTKLSQLSGGEQDKLSFAMTVAISQYLNNGFLVFDESFNSMDSESRVSCLRVFSEFSFGDCVIIMISHNDLGIEGNRVNV